MKRVMITVALISLGGCVTQHERMASLSISMTLLNQGQPFVSRAFAERLARLVLAEKYPQYIFSAHASGVVVDKGEMWAATFDNALVSAEDKSSLPMYDGRIVPKRLTITIRKSNGEIVDIS